MKKLKNIKKLVPKTKKIKVLNETRQCLAWKRENIIKCKASDNGEMLNYKKLLLLPPKIEWMENNVLHLFVYLFMCVRGAWCRRAEIKHKPWVVTLGNQRQPPRLAKPVDQIYVCISRYVKEKNNISTGKWQQHWPPAAVATTIWQLRVWNEVIIFFCVFPSHWHVKKWG